MQLLLGHWPMDKPVRLLSVTAANLLPENQSCEQLSLFDAAEDIQKRDRQHKLDQTVDALRQKLGDLANVLRVHRRAAQQKARLRERAARLVHGNGC